MRDLNKEIKKIYVVVSFENQDTNKDVIKRSKICVDLTSRGETCFNYILTNYRQLLNDEKTSIEDRSFIIDYSNISAYASYIKRIYFEGKPVHEFQCIVALKSKEI